MQNKKTAGYLISFCGLDGCGKTTQIKMLEEYIKEKGINVFLTKQPTSYVRQSEIFRTYMDCPDHSSFDYRSLSLLAASDRIQHINKVIVPEMQKNKVVISDRYYYSCLANLRARGYKDDQWIYDVARFIVKPDLSFFLDVSVETAVSRVRKRPEEENRYIDMDLQYKLRKEYINICKKNNGVLLSTEKTKEECFEIIKTEFERMIDNG